MNMTDKQAKHDLEALIEFFEEESGGCVPVVLEYCLQKIQEDIKNNNEDQS